ncbi:MAG TPA: DNA polymerase III subunit delta [Candidatus Obscuribacterales bacterium]
MHHLYFLLGSDQYARLEQLNKWVEEWIEPEWRDLNLERLDSAQPVSAVIDGWLTAPFWGERRVIVAEYQGDALAQLLEELANLCRERLPQTDNCLVIQADSIDKRRKDAKELLKLAKVCEFQEVKRWNVQQDLYPWIEEQVRRSSKRITRPAIEQLVHACGSDKFALRQALDKLLVYLGDESQIEVEAVRLLVSQTETDIFLLLELIAARNRDQAFSHLQTLLLKDHANKILSTLGTMINRLFQARWLAAQGHSQQEIAQALGLNPYVVKMDLQRWKNYRLEQLETGLNRLLELQTRTRSSRLSPDLALELWLGEMVFG